MVLVNLYCLIWWTIQTLLIEEFIIDHQADMVKANAALQVGFQTPKQKKKTAVELFTAKSGLFSDELSNITDNQMAIEDKISPWSIESEVTKFAKKYNIKL